QAKGSGGGPRLWRHEPARIARRCAGHGWVRPCPRSSRAAAESHSRRFSTVAKSDACFKPFFAAHDVFFLFKSDSKKTIPQYGNIVALFGRYVAAKHQNIPTDVQAVVRGKHTDVYDRQARSGVGQLWRT